MQKVLAHYGIETDLYETRTSLGIQMVGTARDLRTHELVGFYINDTSHVDKHKDGRLERTQTVFVPRWRLEQALNVPGGDAIVTRNRIR